MQNLGCGFNVSAMLIVAIGCLEEITSCAPPWKLSHDVHSYQWLLYVANFMSLVYFYHTDMFKEGITTKL
jgi:hypothetical protein